MTTSSTPSTPTRRPGLSGGTWQDRLAFIVEMMRDISRQNDPQSLVSVYGKRMRSIIPVDGFIAVSRRDLAHPHYRITRSSTWKTQVNPWKARDMLPMYSSGLLGELIYAEEPRVLNDLQLSPDDPAAEYFQNHGSAIAIPMYDQGRALNMVVFTRKERNAFDPEQFPEHVWISNLFGRVTQNLVLGHELKEAYEAVDRELQVVADIQRSLLPRSLPEIPTLELAAYYQTSRRAGGDYYDFFPISDGRWGFLIADVSGHGTPAAVIMAVTHSIAHTHGEDPEPPSKLLNFVNRHLCARYTAGTGSFVTAFYGIYDPRNRTIVYANAGHNPPRHKRAGRVVLGSLEGGLNLPLGIDPDEEYADCAQKFEPGDAFIFYTDGITEARGARNELFGTHRLDEILLACDCDVHDVAHRTIAAVEQFTGGAAPTDDRTMLVARVS